VGPTSATGYGGNRVTEICPDADIARAAVLGGTLLGGGGGGARDQGLALSTMAVQVGQPRIANIDDLDPEAILVTVGLVGSPASEHSHVKPVHYLRAVEALAEQLTQPVAGIITNENGGVGTVNGWFQSAVLGIPVVDAPCNGRAHPTGTMGSMGLDILEGYQSVQAFAGGGRQRGYVEGIVKGQLAAVAGLVRTASVSAGGLVAVARNPVTARLVRENGAPGAIHQAIELGQLIVEKQHLGGRAVAEACVNHMGGSVLIEGRVTRFSLETRGGFDIGSVTVQDRRDSVRLTFWNEYMTAAYVNASGGCERRATFPDLTATINCQSGLPMTTAEMREGTDVVVITVPRANLRLGSTMRRRDLLEEVEQVTGESILKHLRELN
jgi:DUF917 family protein